MKKVKKPRDIVLWPSLERSIERKYNKYGPESKYPISGVNFFIWQCPECLRTHICYLHEDRYCNGFRTVNSYSKNLLKHGIVHHKPTKMIKRKLWENKVLT